MGAASSRGLPQLARKMRVAPLRPTRRGATLLRRVSRQAIKHDLHNNLKGVLWKRNHNMPRFQRRAVYVTPMYAEGPPALCYVGPPPNNFEKQIPLASISSATVWVDKAIWAYTRSPKAKQRAF
jgi:hypothetical protein